MERGYGERLVKSKILKARGESRKAFLNKEIPELLESKLTFNITYYPAFQNVRSILQELQIFLVPNKEHKKVFIEVLIVEFQNGKSLKVYLVRPALPKMDNARGSELRGKSIGQVCDHIIATNTFATKAGGKYLKFKKDPYL